MININNKIFNTIKFLAGANNFEALPQINLPEIAFWGRSNVGKSSTINSIFNNNSAARVSKKPGSTQQINLFLIGQNQAVLADLPGYGYAKVSKKNADNLYKLCYDYIYKRQSKIIFVLIDSRRGLMDIDLEAINALNSLGHSMCLLLTKIDLVTKERILQLKSELEGLDYIMISNSSKVGIAEVQHKIKNIINMTNERKNHYKQSN
jgi:GTP-binding protein